MKLVARRRQHRLTADQVALMRTDDDSFMAANQQRTGSEREESDRSQN